MPTLDHVLLEAAREGRRDAFAEIVRVHFRVAYATALAIVQDATDAEDVVQDSFIRCWQRLHQCRDAAAFGAWMRSVVRSVAQNHLERERIRETRPLRGTEPSRRSSPELDLERRLLRTRLKEAMSGLTAIQREVLLLYDLEGFRHAEIATLLGVSELMSRRHLTNARRRMRQALEDPAMRTVKE